MGLVGNTGISGTSPEPRKPNGGIEMRLNWKRMMVALAAVALAGGGSALASPSPSADSSVYWSGRASALLTEIQRETAQLGPPADTLKSFAGNPSLSWQSHATYLDRVKGHINAVRERIAELRRIGHAVHPWQQQAITQVTSHAAQLAASTQAAILHLRENQTYLFAREYTDHLTTIADRSEDMKQTLDKFLDYGKTQQKLQRLQAHLELAGA